MCSAAIKHNESNLVSMTTPIISADNHPEANGGLIGSVLNGRSVASGTGEAEARDSADAASGQPIQPAKPVAETHVHRNKYDSWAEATNASQQ
jgi:hypothetical protein